MCQFIDTAEFLSLPPHLIQKIVHLLHYPKSQSDSFLRLSLPSRTSSAQCGQLSGVVLSKVIKPFETSYRTTFEAFTPYFS